VSVLCHPSDYAALLHISSHFRSSMSSSISMLFGLRGPAQQLLEHNFHQPRKRRYRYPVTGSRLIKLPITQNQSGVVARYLQFKARPSATAATGFLALQFVSKVAFCFSGRPFVDVEAMVSHADVEVLGIQPIIARRKVGDAGETILVRRHTELFRTARSR
jgi:hypothetical protein